MKRPLVMHMDEYFSDKSNWKPVWEDKDAGLRIDKLKHTTITRLVHTNVFSSYIGLHDVTLLYSLEAKCGDDEWLGEYLTDRPNHQEIRDAIKHQWREDIE